MRQRRVSMVHSRVFHWSGESGRAESDEILQAMQQLGVHAACGEWRKRRFLRGVSLRISAKSPRQRDWHVTKARPGRPTSQATVPLAPAAASRQSRLADTPQW